MVKRNIFEGKCKVARQSSFLLEKGVALIFYCLIRFISYYNSIISFFGKHIFHILWTILVAFVLLKMHTPKVCHRIIFPTHPFFDILHLSLYIHHLWVFPFVSQNTQSWNQFMKKLHQARISRACILNFIISKFKTIIGVFP